MKDLHEETKMKCEEFLNELEGLPANGPVGATPGELLAELPAEAQKHAAECASCEEALQVFAETREALAGMKARQAEPGPWFATRVMGAIRAREEEIEESRNNVWVSVRKFAPRMTAFAAVVLLLGGTWAIQIRRTERQARAPEMGATESLFEQAPSTQVNDDIVASINEEPQ